MLHHRGRHRAANLIALPAGECNEAAHPVLRHIADAFFDSLHTRHTAQHQLHRFLGARDGDDALPSLLPCRFAVSFSGVSCATILPLSMMTTRLHVIVTSGRMWVEESKTVERRRATESDRKSRPPGAESSPTVGSSRMRTPGSARIACAIPDPLAISLRQLADQFLAHLGESADLDRVFHSIAVVLDQAHARVRRTPAAPIHSNRGQSTMFSAGIRPRRQVSSNAPLHRGRRSGRVPRWAEKCPSGCASSWFFPSRSARATPMISPFSTLNETWSTARVGPKYLVRSWTSLIGLLWLSPSPRNLDIL